MKVADIVSLLTGIEKNDVRRYAIVVQRKEDDSVRVMSSSKISAEVQALLALGMISVSEYVRKYEGPKVHDE